MMLCLQQMKKQWHFGLAHFPGLFYLGFISFHFFLLTIYFFHLFLLGYTLFTFFNFLIIWKPLQQGKEEHITKVNQSIMKYDTYSYRSITHLFPRHYHPWLLHQNFVFQIYQFSFKDLFLLFRLLIFLIPQTQM